MTEVQLLVRNNPVSGEVATRRQRNCRWAILAVPAKLSLWPDERHQGKFPPSDLAEH